jgi:hypothetical protein
LDIAMIHSRTHLDVIPIQWAEIVEAIGSHVPSMGYVHWEELREASHGISSEGLWAALKLARAARKQLLPIESGAVTPLHLCGSDELNRTFHLFDRASVGSWVVSNSVERCIASSRRREAIASASLDGIPMPAARADDLLRSGRDPAGPAESAIAACALALEVVQTEFQKPLSTKGLMELNRRLVSDPPGSMRADPGRLERLCAFANGSGSDPFFHPLIRAAVLEYGLIQESPFADANGRTARAAFQWTLLHHGYPAIGTMSVSAVLARDPAAYELARRRVETDEYDVTYFVLHVAGAVRQALDDLRDWSNRLAAELAAAEQRVPGFAELNPRQQSVMEHALRNRATRYQISSHQRSHGVTHQTARDDLFDLVRRDLLQVSRESRRYVFTVPSEAPARDRVSPPRVRTRREASELDDELPTNLR